MHEKDKKSTTDSGPKHATTKIKINILQHLNNSSKEMKKTYLAKETNERNRDKIQREQLLRHEM